MSICCSNKLTIKWKPLVFEGFLTRFGSGFHENVQNPDVSRTADRSRLTKISFAWHKSCIFLSMQQKKIMLASIFAATAVGVFILFIRKKKNRTFIHHPKPYERPHGVAEMEFTV